MDGKRRALLIAVVGAVLVAVATGLLIHRGPIDLAPLEADLTEARAMLGKSGRQDWASRAADDAARRLNAAKRWNEALATGAPAIEREKWWTEWRRYDAACRKSLPDAREQMRLISGDRW